MRSSSKIYMKFKCDEYENEEVSEKQTSCEDHLHFAVSKTMTSRAEDESLSELRP